MVFERFSRLAMNKASFLIQELLGLPETSSDVAAAPAPTLQKQVDGERELQGTNTNATSSGHRPCCKRSREDVNSVGDEIPSPEGEILQGAVSVSSTTFSPGSATKSNKRLRTAFTSWQLRELEYTFRMCPYPDGSLREQIASTTGIEETKIQVWFQNRRARYRKREKPLQKRRSHTAPTIPPQCHNPAPISFTELPPQSMASQQPHDPMSFHSFYPLPLTYGHPPYPYLPPPFPHLMEAAMRSHPAGNRAKNSMKT